MYITYISYAISPGVWGFSMLFRGYSGGGGVLRVYSWAVPELLRARYRTISARPFRYRSEAVRSMPRRLVFDRNCTTIRLETSARMCHELDGCCCWCAARSAVLISTGATAQLHLFRIYWEFCLINKAYSLRRVSLSSSLLKDFFELRAVFNVIWLAQFFTHQTDGFVLEKAFNPAGTACKSRVLRNIWYYCLFVYLFISAQESGVCVLRK